MHQSPRNALVSAMRFARHERSLRGVRCTIKVETERKVYIDPPRLRQVLFNLVRNAGHAMRDGQIEASQAYILLRCCDEGPEGVCLEVQDNGKGMDSAVAQRVYEQGFSAAGKGGLGVGLTVCQRIIQAHGGRIDFDSTPGVGTIFRLHLPGTLPKASSSSQPGGLAPVPSRL
jgi:signal transduction histidine kinase